MTHHYGAPSIYKSFHIQKKLDLIFLEEKKKENSPLVNLAIKIRILRVAHSR